MRSAITSIASLSVLLMASSRVFAVGHHARKFQRFGDPASIVLAVQLDGKVHTAIPPQRPQEAFPLAPFPCNLRLEQDDDSDRRSQSRVESGKEALAGGDPGGGPGGPAPGDRERGGGGKK